MQVWNAGSGAAGPSSGGPPPYPVTPRHSQSGRRPLGLPGSPGCCIKGPQAFGHRDGTLVFPREHIHSNRTCNAESAAVDAHLHSLMGRTDEQRAGLSNLSSLRPHQYWNLILSLHLGSVAGEVVSLKIGPWWSSPNSSAGDLLVRPGALLPQMRQLQSLHIAGPVTGQLSGS